VPNLDVKEWLALLVLLLNALLSFLELRQSRANSQRLDLLNGSLRSKGMS